MSTLAGKVAVVTGASKGIGAGIAKAFGAAGASVVVNYSSDKSGADKIVDTITKAGGKAIAVQGNVSKLEDAQAIIDAAIKAYGKLDILVNNAGTAIPKPFEEGTIEEFDHVLALNVRAVFITTQAALKHLNDGGRIITIGSCVGERMMTPGLAVYSATKGAVKMFSQGLSREVGGRGITVNTVQPGPIDTDLNPASGDWAAPQKAMTALNRYGTVDEVAALVAFVASPEAAYITGANLTVDGGTNA